MKKKVDFKNYNYYFNNISKEWEEKPIEYLRNKYTGKIWYNGEWVETLPN